VLTLCPLGQPEKALGHESQIEPWLTPYNRKACQVSETEWRRRDQKMELLRWNNADPNPGARHQTSVFRGEKGLDVAENIRASGGGRKMFLTSSLIEQAFTLTIWSRVIFRRNAVTPLRVLGYIRKLAALPGVGLSAGLLWESPVTKVQSA